MRVATDISGTFTDLVYLDDQGRVGMSKVDTTSPDFEEYDPGLRAARELTQRMVVTAPAEACLRIAATLGESTAILVGRRKWVPEMKENVHKYGYKEKLAGFKILDMGVHDFQACPSETKRRILEAAREAVERDGADVIVLGCTAEFGFYHAIQQEIGVPVVDAVVAPVKFAEFLVHLRKLGWGHSKRVGYEGPPVQEVAAWGLFQGAHPLDKPT